MAEHKFELGQKIIILTQGQKAIVDDDIFNKYSTVPFYASKVKDKFYARTSRTLLPNSIRTYLHHLVIGKPSSKQWMVCFKNGNSLDCRRENLQYIRKSDNTQKHSKTQTKRVKSSKYLGVTFRPAHFRARIKFDGKTINIGEYKTEKEAAKAYNEYAKKLFGDKAKLNEVFL